MEKLRLTDQETARVVAVLNKDDAVVGAGCLVDGAHVLTCAHVVSRAAGEERVVRLKLIGTLKQ